MNIGKRSLAFAFLASIAAGPLFALAVPNESLYAQKLVDETIAHNPDLLDVIFHVTKPHEDQNYAIAAHTKHELGAKSGEDDLGVATTGKPLVEVQKDAVRIGVIVQLHDKSGKSIGALGLMYPYKAGEAETNFLIRSETIRDQLAKNISSIDALFEEKD